MSTHGESSKTKARGADISIEENVQHKVRKLNRNARLRGALENDKHSATDDDTNLEELNIRDLERRVENLKQTISTVNKENGRLQKEVQDLRKRSLEEEIDNLQTDKVTDEEIDPVYRMKKLLRRFSDLMVVSTISDDMKEECPVCLEPFKVKECSALECGHLICNVCLPIISRAATRDTEELRCPQCRRYTPREKLELVHMTETERWDALLKVAQAWIAYDRRGELETSEEEYEETFITDGNGTSEATSEAESGQSIDDAPAQDTDPEEPDVTSPPVSATGFLFSGSPTNLKRKRMEELAAERSQRRRT